MSVEEEAAPVYVFVLVGSRLFYHNKNFALEPTKAQRPLSSSADAREAAGGELEGPCSGGVCALLLLLHCTHGAAAATRLRGI